MDEKKYRKEYRTESLIVYWYPSHCSHSGKCINMLPRVFDMHRRPWICLDDADPLEVIKAVDKCPSGALKYRLSESSEIDPELAKGPGSMDYRVAEQMLVQIRMVSGGPLLVKGPARIVDHEGKVIRECESMVLCRCGRTKNPPFCDGSHSEPVK
jgi:uncharacterized Fe-S cluster protein YjdI